MNNLKKLFITLLLPSLSFAQLVTTQAELDTAINNASAGTIITLKDGTWTNLSIEIDQKDGISGNPIIIKAETSGAVFLEGNSKALIKRSSFITFTGVVFQNASGLVTDTSGSKPEIDPVVRFDRCDDCVLTDIKIDSYNGTLAQELDTFKWVLTDGMRNEISYCSFIGKNGIGSIINDNRNSSTPGEDFLKIHHNYFADRTPVTGGFNGKNDQDAIRIGNSSTSLMNSSSEVYENYFFNFSGEIEIISNKSGNNKYYNNTFRRVQGALTLRHGNDCEVYGNFFFGENVPSSSGVRVVGERHKVYNNYFQELNHVRPNGSNSNVTGAINIHNGRVVLPSGEQDPALNGYFQVKEATIVNNTFVKCSRALRVGTQVSTSAGTFLLPPEDTVIANNIFLDSSDRAIQQVTAPVGTSKYEGNIKQDERSWDVDNIMPNNNNQDVASGLLSMGADFYELATGSAAIDNAFGSYSFLTNDIFNGPRPVNFDAGAEEFGTTRNRAPFMATDVGANIGFGAMPLIIDPTLSIPTNDFSKNKITLFPNPTSGSNTVTLVGFKDETITIYDLTGKLISAQISDEINNSKKIDTSLLSKGVYFLNVAGTNTKKLIVN